MTNDTGKVKLPSIPTVTTGNAGLDRWMQAVTERLEVREGTRGNPYERVVTLRELSALGIDSQAMANVSSSTAEGVVVQLPGGGFSRVPLNTFSEELRKTKLYADLMRSIDDAGRFDEVPEQVRTLLLGSIAEEAARRGADIRHVETRLQSATQSLAFTVDEVTAAVTNASAGVREVSYASTTANLATAGKVTQVQARLDTAAIDPADILPTVYATLAALQAAVPVGVPGKYYQVAGTPVVLYRWSGSAYVVGGSGTTATVEQKLSASVDRNKGAEAQYTLKVSAGGALAGFGLAATNSSGTPSSAFIISADKFAVVSPSYTGGLTNSPNVANVPFGVDASGVYIKGTLRIDTGGTTTGSLISTANTASSTATAASSTATAASSTAATALTTATAASSTAATASSTAATANTTANAAQTTAATANSTANAASSTANAASSTANAASSTANAANSTAATALTTATAAQVAAAAATTALTGKLSKSGADTMQGPISLTASNAILVGTVNDGLYMGSTGLVGRKASQTTFSITADGTALFAGELSAATGTFAGSVATTGTLDVAGNGTVSSYDASAHFNKSYTAPNGVVAYAGTGTAIFGIANTTTGMNASSNSGTGLVASSGSGSALTASNISSTAPTMIVTATLAQPALRVNAGTGDAVDVTSGKIATAGQIVSTVATGTAPISVASTTVCPNLNATYWDGVTMGGTLADGTAALPVAHSPAGVSPVVSTVKWLKITVGTTTGYIPIYI